jgi:hypothetical protein
MNWSSPKPSTATSYSLSASIKTPYENGAAEVDGNSWRVRIKNFPDELMYSLMVGSENAGDFHDAGNMAAEQRCLAERSNLSCGLSPYENNFAGKMGR